MALGLTKYTNTGIESAESVATGTLEWASDTSGTVLNAGNGEWYAVVLLQISVTFNASATGDAEVHVRKSSDDGTTEDTPEEGTYLGTIECSAGNTVIRTFEVFDFDYLDVGVKNNDASYTLSWTGIYSGYKITGMA